MPVDNQTLENEISERMKRDKVPRKKAIEDLLKEANDIKGETEQEWKRTEWELQAAKIKVDTINARFPGLGERLTLDTQRAVYLKAFLKAEDDLLLSEN